MYGPRVDLFQTIRFLSDVGHQINFDVTPLENSHSLFGADVPVSIRALRFRMMTVLPEKIGIRLDANCIATAKLAIICRDPVFLA